MDDFEAVLGGQFLINKELRTYVAVRDSQQAASGQNRYSFSSLASQLGVNIPTDVFGALFDDQLYVSLYGFGSGPYGRGVMIKIKDRTLLQSALEAWKPQMAANLNRFFAIDPAQAASPGFLVNEETYPGISITYRNFPTALKTIDYALLIANSGDAYFILTNSKDHMFAIIDKFQISANR